MEVQYIFLNTCFPSCCMPLVNFQSLHFFLFWQVCSVFSLLFRERFCWAPYLAILEVLLLKWYKLHKLYKFILLLKGEGGTFLGIWDPRVMSPWQNVDFSLETNWSCRRRSSFVDQSAWISGSWYLFSSSYSLARLFQEHSWITYIPWKKSSIVKCFVYIELNKNQNELTSGLFGAFGMLIFEIL